MFLSIVYKSYIFNIYLNVYCLMWRGFKNKVSFYQEDIVDAGEIQGQLEWPGSLVESGSQEQCSAERSRHCEGLLEEGKLPEFQVTMKLKDLEFYAFFMSPSIQRWENERNLIF